MAAPDLPIELWLEILQYLPRSALHGMLGLSRVLFEVVMNDLYEEIRFISDDKAMLKTFDQMKFAGIASRVRRLLIQPAFLPALEERTGLLPKVQDRLSSRWWFNKPLRISPARPVVTFNPLGTPEELEVSRNKALRAATGALALCHNLQTVTIVLYDHTATPQFNLFLDSLWQSPTIGVSNLRSLSIRTTPAKLPRLLLPLVESSKMFVNLEEVTFDITPSRLELAGNDHNRAVDALKSFFKAFGNNLIAVNLSSTRLHLVESVLGSMQPLLRLRKFELLTSLSSKQRWQPENISKFIANHASVLEHLTIKPYARRTVYHESDITYARWINPGINDATRPSAFAGVVFPKLKSLDVGLRDPSETAPYTWPPALPSRSHSSLLPNPSIFAPNITSLTLTDVSLSFPRIRDLVNQLAEDRSGGRILEKLNIMVETLTPPVFDILASKLPHLRMLTMDFNIISDLEEVRTYREPDRSLEFRELIRARRYPRWKLQYLRLTSVGFQCSARHPQPTDMGVVAESLPSGVELDSSYDCYCHMALDSPVFNRHMIHHH
ncbi:hypothetical protein GALMADRAFT_142557 [Galerina marginata CBS 339.88]|uniref:F-box domain-containing protein n=1 Tax=Galerina marginata (strain CBS 339.88) TaxID=685588 RepID=A0A067SRZ7_GALM3|nr:hypothetical protein GALMADRAFT_142557 [Galerina marginata CBS 339.88]